MDNVPKTTFVNSVDTEAERIIYTAAQIARGFYFSNKFAVLPEIPTKSASVVVLPDVAYSNIKDYWNRIGSYDVEKMEPGQSAKLFDGVKELFVFQKSTNLTTRKREWKRIFPKVWTYLKVLYPEKSAYIESLEIRMTRYGTKASWGLLRGDKPQKFICYLREDVEVDYLVEALFTAMVRFKSQNLDEEWHDTEAFVDYLLSSTDISRILPHFKPTLLNHAERFVWYKESSTKYLAKHGLVFSDSTLAVEGKKIMINNIDRSAQFSPKERQIVRLLVTKSNAIVSYDELFEGLWGDAVEKHSLWALSRLVSRTRSKLAKLGISSKSIQSVYGRGYLFSR